jgi:hypothetical protein
MGSKRVQNLTVIKVKMQLFQIPGKQKDIQFKQKQTNKQLQENLQIVFIH